MIFFVLVARCSLFLFVLLCMCVCVWFLNSSPDSQNEKTKLKTHLYSYAIFSYLHFNEYDRLSVRTLCRLFHTVLAGPTCAGVYTMYPHPNHATNANARLHVLYHLYKLQWKTIIYYKLLWDRNFLFRFSLLLHFSETTWTAAPPAPVVAHQYELRKLLHLIDPSLLCEPLLWIQLFLPKVK